MAIRPILFSAPMVRALLDGRKTQTRRVLKPQPQIVDELASEEQESLEIENRLFGEEGRWIVLAKPLPDEVGDLRWVREPWRTRLDFDALPPREIPIGSVIQYDATGPTFDEGLSGRSRPGMFLPRWASRLTLRVTGVKVERLQDISEEDAKAEGVYCGKASGRFADNYATMAVGGIWFASARGWYADLWDRINGPDAWAGNPWVGAVTFETIKANVDEVLRAEAS